MCSISVIIIVTVTDCCLNILAGNSSLMHDPTVYAYVYLRKVASDCVRSFGNAEHSRDYHLLRHFHEAGLSSIVVVFTFIPIHVHVPSTTIAGVVYTSYAVTVATTKMVASFFIFDHIIVGSAQY